MLPGGGDVTRRNSPWPPPLARPSWHPHPPEAPTVEAPWSQRREPRPIAIVVMLSPDGMASLQRLVAERRCSESEAVEWALRVLRGREWGEP